MNLRQTCSVDGAIDSWVAAIDEALDSAANALGPGDGAIFERLREELRSHASKRTRG